MNASPVIAALVLLGTLHSLVRGEPSPTPTTAREYLESGELGRARKAYETLRQRRPNDPALAYNAGVAAYRGTDFEAAARHFEDALGGSDLSLQQRAYFNLGNTLFQRGSLEEEAGARQQLWEKAREDFQAATDLAPGDADARHNLEVVERRLKELKEQQQQSPQQQQQQQQGGDSKDSKDQKDQKDQQDQKDKRDQQDRQQQQQQKDSSSGKQEKDSKDSASSDGKGGSSKDPQQGKDSQGKEGEKSKPEGNEGRAGEKKEKSPGSAGEKPGEKSGGQQPGQEPGSEGGPRPAGSDERGEMAGAAGQGSAAGGEKQRMSVLQAERVLDRARGEERALIWRPAPTGEEARRAQRPGRPTW